MNRPPPRLPHTTAPIRFDLQKRFQVLTELGLGQFNHTDKPMGIAKPVRVFNHKNERVTVDVQVDLV